MTTPLPCPRCGDPARVKCAPPPIPDRRFDYSVMCSEACAEDDSIVGYGRTRDAAVAEWNDQVESYLDTEAREIASKLHPLERDLLLERYEGGWGAAVGAALESLRGNGLIVRVAHLNWGYLTHLGERVAAALREIEQRQNADARQGDGSEAGVQGRQFAADDGVQPDE